jgi:predicted metal-dependent phosphoesterase TrpH
MIRVDLHVHTCYSYDCWLSLETLIDVVQRRGLDAVAVLDHDRVDGALRLRRIAPFKVIVGEEIGTAHGAIAALFIEQRIPPHLSAEETIARIRAQHGLVFIPHPLARAVPGRIQEAKLRQIVKQVDLIEGYNARAPLTADDRRARQFAARHGIPIAACSDGHFPSEIGRAWTEMDDFVTPQQFLESLQRARLHYTTKTCFLLPALTVASIPALTAWRALRRVLRWTERRAVSS